MFPRRIKPARTPLIRIRPHGFSTDSQTQIHRLHVYGLHIEATLRLFKSLHVRWMRISLLTCRKMILPLVQVSDLNHLLLTTLMKNHNGKSLILNSQTVFALDQLPIFRRSASPCRQAGVCNLQALTPCLAAKDCRPTSFVWRQRIAALLARIFHKKRGKTPYNVI